MHPSKDIIGSESEDLNGKKIVLCITGSVAAVRCPDLARKLMRQGAEVRAVMSESATELITPQLMHWATGNRVVHELTGSIEHVELAQWADVILVAPSTANTIGKIVNGIDDTPPTSVVSVTQGLRKPIMVVPAMHRSMYTSEVTQENISRLKDTGIHFLKPTLEEGKAKIPSIEEIVVYLKSFLHPNDLEGKRVLVTAGPTVERLDPVRILTNRSSGKMGISIARAAVNRGAEVTLVYGPGSEPEPPDVETIRVETTEDMLEAVTNELEKDYDLFIAAAAPQDFKPKKIHEEKLRRKEAISVDLIPTLGILEEARRVAPDIFIVGFKAECNVTDEQLEKAADEKMKEHDLDLVVANDVMRPKAGFGTDTNDVILYSERGSTHLKTSKIEIANSILDSFLER